MFCPQCRTEYREGITVCADCSVPLVKVLPDIPEPEYQELTTVFESSDQADVLVARSLLESAEIDYFAAGDGLMDLMGGGRIGFNPVVGAIKIQVRPEDADEAREILSELGNEAELDTDEE